MVQASTGQSCGLVSTFFCSLTGFSAGAFEVFDDRFGIDTLRLQQLVQHLGGVF